MKNVTVVNLKTEDELIYMDKLPSEAVIFAYLHSIGQNNTWEYDRLYFEYYPKLVWGKKTVSMGDFCAYKKHDFMGGRLK
jgi:hypothetical protein